MSKWENWLLSRATEAIAINAPNQASKMALLEKAEGNAAWSPFNFVNKFGTLSAPIGGFENLNYLSTRTSPVPLQATSPP